MEDHEYEPISNPTDFHIYEIEWTPDYIQWKVDDIVKRTVYAGAASVNFMNKPNVLMMNFWTPTWSPWGDGRNDSSMPWYVLYDYVEAYTYNTSTKQFSLDFRDDFSGVSVNTGIWTLSDWWNFGGSSTMFLASQTYQENGNLVLKMEKHYYAMDASDLIN